MPRPKKVSTEAQTEPKKQPHFSITLRIGNDVYSGEGETALEALQKIEKPVKIFQKSVLTVREGDKSKEMLMMPVKVKRIFFPSSQPIIVKWLFAGLR